MTALVALLLTVTVLVPHGDDEITLLPLIQAADAPMIVVMTDGAATSRCPATTSCEDRRRASTVSFLNETAPSDHVLIWLGWPDGTLPAWYVRMVAINLGGDLWAAGADYGHPDHTAVRTAVRSLHGELYDGQLRDDPQAKEAMMRHYGWLLSEDQYGIVGLR